MNIFLIRLSLSSSLAKTLRLNKIKLPWKSFSKLCRSESYLNRRYRPPFMYKINIQHKWLKGCKPNYVCECIRDCITSLVLFSAKYVRGAPYLILSEAWDNRFNGTNCLSCPSMPCRYFELFRKSMFPEGTVN